MYTTLANIIDNCIRTRFYHILCKKHLNHYHSNQDVFNRNDMSITFYSAVFLNEVSWSLTGPRLLGLAQHHFIIIIW